MMGWQDIPDAPWIREAERYGMPEDEPESGFYLDGPDEEDEE